MKNIYSLLTLFLVFFTVSLSGQSRIYAPELRAPENEETEIDPNVMLDWDAVTGSTLDITYEAQLATKEDFSDAITYDRTDLTAVETEQLFFNEMYYWRVKAFDAEEPSDWSEVWTFTVISTVDIKTPKIGADVYAQQEITWNEITGLKMYQLNIDTSYVWNQVNTGTTEDANATFVLNDTSMWIVGNGGLVQNFNGTDWVTIDAGTTNDLFSVYFIDGSNGYVVGEDGIILYFNGTDWSTQDAGITNDLNGVSFVDGSNGWAVGADGAIINYKDGTWSEVTTDNTEDLAAVFALTTTDVWACGNGKTVTHFNGTDWSVEQIGSRDLYAIWFVDANNGWIAGKSGKIQYFNGTEWTEQTSGTNKDIYGLSFVGMNGFGVGKDGTMISYDGGWSVITSGVSETLNGIWLNGDLGLSAGEEGTVILKSGQGFDSPYNRIYSISKDSVTKLLEYLPFGSKVYYRMRAMHESDTSVWSSPRSMNVYAAPELDKPKDGTEDVDLMTEFEWDEYEGVIDYYFELDDNAEFTDPFNAIVDSLSIYETMQLYGHEYFWRVRTQHAYDISDWSEVWTVQTKSIVELESPEDGTSDVASCPLYVWEPIEGSLGYQIYVDTDPDFSDPMTSMAEEAEYQCQSPMPKKTKYYWKVRAMSKQDTSSWSATWSFETEGFAGIEDEFGVNSFTVYPNPSNGLFSLNINSYSQEDVTLTVSDLTGKEIYSEAIHCNSGENSKEIRLDDIRQGIYLISLKNDKDNVTKKLFIK